MICCGLRRNAKPRDLHLKVGNYPHLRIDGELVPLTDQPRISAEDMLTMAFSMMSARQKQKFKETTEIDMAYGVAGLGRFRVNIFQQRGNVGLVLRVIPDQDSRARRIVSAQSGGADLRHAARAGAGDGRYGFR
jgi:Tfp pilus assembly pilus retraction ATPase PilT